MRNIFVFIRRYFTFIAFITMQVCALYMLFKYNTFHHSVGLGLASEFTGTINKQVDKLDDYFHQGEENRRVHRMNDSLMNLLKSNFTHPDTARKTVTDTLSADSAISVRRYVWRAAKVVYATEKNDKNYLQIDKGSNFGIRENMAVLNSDASLVGMVVNVSSNFSEVMSLLHVQNSVSASIKKTGESGRIEWDGKDPRFLVMKGIPKNVQVQVGDSIVTSRYSYNFPPNYLIGYVAGIGNDPASGFFLLRVKVAANFNTLQQVFVVENVQRDEQVQLDKDTERKMEQQKKPSH